MGLAAEQNTCPEHSPVDHEHIMCLRSTGLCVQDMIFSFLLLSQIGEMLNLNFLTLYLIIINIIIICINIYNKYI